MVYQSSTAERMIFEKFDVTFAIFLIELEKFEFQLQNALKKNHIWIEYLSQ